MPAATMNGVREKPNGVTGELRGCSQPHVLASRTPSTTRASPSARQHRPDTVELGPLALAARREQAHAEQDPDHDHDLAGEDEPPSQVRW